MKFVHLVEWLHTLMLPLKVDSFSFIVTLLSGRLFPNVYN
jgi:hypothetical protein